MFNENDFHRFMIENQIIDIFENPITLKSGAKSHIYINWRKATNSTRTIEWLSENLLSFVKDKNLKPDCFLGVPEGASKLAIISNYKFAKAENFDVCLPMARGKTKSHGAPEDKYFIGSPKGNVVIIEDVVTTGGSLINFIDQIKDLDITIKGVVCLTNRNTKSNVLDAQLKERNIQLHSMSNLKNLIADFLSIKNISNPELLYELKNELNFVEQKQAI